MSEDLREQLSAFMDGELGRDERAFLMRRLEHDAQLRAAWTRMHLIRDVISHRPGGAATLNLADGVMQALADEERVVPKAMAANSRAAWRPWAGFAVAASVAMAAIFAVTPQRGFDNGASLADSAPAPRAALPVGVPGPMVPSLQDMGSGVQPVAGERSRVLSAAPVPMNAEQMLLMRHGQVVDGSWWVGGTQPVYAQPQQRLVVPVSVSDEQP